MVLKQQAMPSFSAILLRQRMAKATELLVQTDLSVSEVAFATGFKTKSAFSTRFRRETGVPPSEFRKR
jgi:AraC-like DNA-binding protein